MGSDTNNLFPAEKTVPGEMTRSNMTENPDVIAVHGWLKLGDGLTRNPRGENAAFEGKRLLPSGKPSCAVRGGYLGPMWLGQERIRRSWAWREMSTVDSWKGLGGMGNVKTLDWVGSLQ